MLSEQNSLRLEGLINSIKRKRGEFVLLEGLLYTALAIFSAVAVVSLLSLLYTGPLYYTLLKTALFIVSIGAGIKFIALPLLKGNESADIVSELESAFPGLGEDSLNAVLLSKDSNNNGLLGTSQELSDAHIEKVTERLESLDKGQLFPKAGLKKTALPVTGTLIAAIIVLFLVPGHFRGYLLSASLTPGSSKGVIELADVELKLTYPGYSGIEPEIIKGGAGDVKALKGTLVEFSAKPLRKFSGGRLVIENGPSLPLEVSRGKIASEFTVTGDGTYHITEQDGKEKSAKKTITAIEDKTPEVSIESPLGDMIEIDGDERIEIFFDASDDFGLGKIKLSIEGDSGGKKERVIADPKNSPNTFQDKVTWDLSSLDIPHAGTIKLRVEAQDNDTISGPKAGVSNAITLKLMDAERKHQEVMNLTEQLFEELIDILGDEIEIAEDMKEASSPESGELNIDLSMIKAAQEPLTLKIESALGTLRTTIASMSEDSMSDFTNFSGLSNMETRIGRLLQSREELLVGFSVVDLPRLGRQMRSEITEFEGDIIFLDNLIKGERLRDSLFSSKELMSEYAQLEELMKQLSQDGDNQALMAEIQKKMEEIQKLMQELAQKMASMSTEMQEGFLNPDAFQSKNMKDMMEQMMKMAQDGDIQSAMDMLSQMMSGLQGMIASLEGGMQSFGSSTMGQQMAKLGELINRIEGIEKEETALMEKTESLKDSMLGGEGDENNLRDFIEKQKEKLRELKDNLAQAQTKISKNTPKGKTPEGSYLIDRMLQKSDELKNWLDAMDFQQAQRNARNLEESTKGLGELGDAGVGNLKKAEPEIDRSYQLAREIRQSLEQFSPEAGGQSPGSSIAERQDEIREETEELSNQAQELSKELPLSPEIGKMLGQAGGHMGKASQRVNEKEISKAISNQGEAIKSLQQAKAKAQQMMQQFSMSARGQGMPTPMGLGQQQSGGTQGIDTRYVEIPKPGESEETQDIKERIMEAMKGGSPEGYGELNKKYYDRIIK